VVEMVEAEKPLGRGGKQRKEFDTRYPLGKQDGLFGYEVVRKKRDCVVKKKRRKGRGLSKRVFRLAEGRKRSEEVKKRKKWDYQERFKVYQMLKEKLVEKSGNESKVENGGDEEKNEFDRDVAGVQRDSKRVIKIEDTESFVENKNIKKERKVENIVEMIEPMVRKSLEVVNRENINKELKNKELKQLENPEEELEIIINEDEKHGQEENDGIEYLEEFVKKKELELEDHKEKNKLKMYKILSKFEDETNEITERLNRIKNNDVSVSSVSIGDISNLSGISESLFRERKLVFRDNVFLNTREVKEVQRYKNSYEKFVRLSEGMLTKSETKRSQIIEIVGDSIIEDVINDIAKEMTHVSDSTVEKIFDSEFKTEIKSNLANNNKYIS